MSEGGQARSFCIVSVCVPQSDVTATLETFSSAPLTAIGARRSRSGKLFPDGSKITKIEWSFKKNNVSPYFVNVPDKLKTVAFIEKDIKRFPDTQGWAYAQWAYDPATDTFKPSELRRAHDRLCIVRKGSHLQLPSGRCRRHPEARSAFAPSDRACQPFRKPD
jgi:hypothetical protein